MKYIKKGLYVFVPLLLCLFALKMYISTNNFRELLTNILKSSGLNVTFEKVELQGFNKLKIDNLIVRDIYGNVFVNSKKTTADINLLVPSRLKKIDVYDATVNIKRKKENHLNVFDIIKPSNKKNSIDRASRLGKLYIHNATLNYSDLSYAQKIEKTLYKVNGFLESAKSRGFTLEAKGNSGNETLGIKLKNPIKGKQNFWSIFDKKKNENEKEKYFEMMLYFKNIKITEALGQYVPLEMIKAKAGILNGNLLMSNNNRKKETIPEGNLRISNGVVWYEDFAGDISNINATVNLKKDENIVDANAKLQNRMVTFKLNQDKLKEKLKLKLTTNKVPLSEISRYKIIKNFNVKTGGEVTSKLDIDVDLKTKNTLLNGNFYSNNAKLENYDLKNVKAKMSLDTKKSLLNADIFSDNVSSGNLNLKNVKAKLILNIKNSLLNADAFSDSVKFENYNLKNVKAKVALNTKNSLMNADVFSDNINFANNYLKNVKAKMNMNIKNSLLNADISSDNAKISNYNFRNLGTKMNFNTKNKIVVLNNTKFNFDETISGFKVKQDVTVPVFTYDMNNRSGSGEYIFTNKGSDFSVKQIAGTATINKDNVISSNFISEEISGNFRINPKSMEMVVNTRSKENFVVRYQKQNYVLKPQIDNLKLAFNNKNILQAGKIKTDLKLENKYVNNINADVTIHNGNYNVNALVTTKNGEVFRVAGNTTSQMKHNYAIELQDKNKILDAVKLMKDYKINVKGLETAKLPIKLEKFNISGDNKKITGEYEISSQYGKYVVEYEQLHAKGKIYDLQKMNLDMNAQMKELWVNYQRFKNVSTNLMIKDNVVNIKKLSNEKQIFANGKYNLKTGHLNIDSKLNDYVVYNTSNPELNLYINNARLNLNGKVDNLSGKINIPDSITMINSKNIGKTKILAEIENNILKLNDVRFQKNYDGIISDPENIKENRLTGKYNLKTGIADVKLNLDERDVTSLIDIPDLNFGMISELELKGNLNKFDLAGFIDLNNINYKGYNLPGVKTEIEYVNGDINKLFNYGILNVKDFRFIGDNKETLFQTNTKIDLANEVFKYKLENQKFSLDSVQDLKNKGYSGDVNINFTLTGKPNDLQAILGINGDAIKMNGLDVKDLNLNISASNKNKIVQISDSSLEYKDNPLKMNGYLQYEPIKYNVQIDANNFDLSFLGLDPNIETATGKLNMNTIFSNSSTSGKIDLKDFNYVTKDKSTSVKDINTNINLVNNQLQIEKLQGGFNGGTFNIRGDLDMPVIPEDFMKTKRLGLGRINIDADLNNLGLKYGEDINYALSGKINMGGDFLTGNLKIDSAEIRGIPNSNEDEKNKIKEEEQLKDKSIAEGIVEQLIDTVLNQYTVNLNIETGDDVKVKIPSMSLVKDINGKVDGSAKVRYDNGGLGLDGTFSLKNTKFYLNSNRFKIDDGKISFVSKDGITVLSDPIINIIASTKVKGEKIEVNVSGTASNPQLSFSSANGKSKDEILSLLAFKTVVGNNSKDNDNLSLSNRENTEDGMVVAGSLINSALNELIFSSVTGKIGETLGLSNFSISTDVDKSEKTGEYSTTATLYAQNNLFRKDKLFWNLEIKVPFKVGKYSSSNTSPSSITYNGWLSYNFDKSLELRVGGETINKTTNTNKNSRTKGNYYIGLDFSTRGRSFGEIFKRMFKNKKLETLKK